MVESIRCTECRKWALASPTTKGGQKVCGKACRKRRNNKLARRRRRENLGEYRLDDRDRKRRSRQSQRAGKTEQMPGLTPQRECESWTGSLACHAPGSPDNLAEVMEKLGQILDDALAMSRARFRRQLGRMRAKGAVQCAVPPARAGP